MELRKAMAEIEGYEFAARLNATSGLTTFLRAAREQPSVQVLSTLGRDATNRVRLLSRIMQLSHERVDPRYENPADTALAVYLWILNRLDIELGRFAAESASRAQQCWWAANISRQILLDDQLRSDSGESRSDPVLADDDIRLTTDARDAGEVILLTGFFADLVATPSSKIFLVAPSTEPREATLDSPFNLYLKSGPRYEVQIESGRSAEINV